MHWVSFCSFKEKWEKLAVFTGIVYLHQNPLFPASHLNFQNWVDSVLTLSWRMTLFSVILLIKDSCISDMQFSFFWWGNNFWGNFWENSGAKNLYENQYENSARSLYKSTLLQRLSFVLKTVMNKIAQKEKLSTGIF